MKCSVKPFNFEREVDEEEVVDVDVGLCGVAIFIIIVCCSGFQLVFSRYNRSSRCGNIGMEVNIGQFTISKCERRGKEGSNWCSVISTELWLSLLTSIEESLLHHPLRFLQSWNLINSRDRKNGTGIDEEEEKSLLSDMYCIPSILRIIRVLREGSWLNGGRYWHFLQPHNLNVIRFVSDETQLGSLKPR
jgi:hypothetical protein